MITDVKCDGGHERFDCLHRVHYVAVLCDAVPHARHRSSGTQRVLCELTRSFFDVLRAVLPQHSATHQT